MGYRLYRIPQGRPWQPHAWDVRTCARTDTALLTGAGIYHS